MDIRQRTVDLLHQRYSPTKTSEPIAAFTVEWCKTCRCPFVRCPRCGNNSCNGTYGEDQKCPVCPITYELMAKIDDVVTR